MKMLRMAATSLLAALSFVLAITLTAAPAQAQATRTWVSGVGDDVNPCSRTAPCKTFAGAISKTAAGGEINCLDPGGYGTLTITKSITVDCTGTFGSALNSGGINGFVINDSATATPGTVDVILRGLSIDGAGTTPGLNGIRIISGRSLLVQDVLIQNQNSGAGVSIQPSTAMEVHLTDVTITDSNNGIVVQPTGAGGSARVLLNDVRVLNVATTGLSLNTSGNTAPAGIHVAVHDSEFSGGTNGITLLTPVGATSAVAMISDTLIANNTGAGISANGASARARVGNTTITRNNDGVTMASGGLIFTYGTNRLDFNSADGAFQQPPLAQE